MGKVRDTVRQNIGVLVEREKSQTLFAKKIGASKQSVNNWLNAGGAPDIEMIAKIASVYNVPLSVILEGDLTSGEYEPNCPGVDWVEVPLFGSIAAGRPIEMDRVESTFYIPADIKARYPEAFLLKVVGESMNRKLPNGSYALINPTKNVIAGKSYAVCVNGYDATIKRVVPLENGCELLPDSTDPTFRGKVYDYGVEGTDTVTVIGEVVWCVYPYDFNF